jgi:hypothetical protein
MTVRRLLALSAAALMLSTLPGRAGPCSPDIDRAWNQVADTIQARIRAGRSAPQSMTALLHHQPTPASIAAAEEQVGERWLPMETAVAALTRARAAERARDQGACEQALGDAQRVLVR